MNYKLFLFILFFTGSNLLISQSFVNNSNKWFVDHCGFAWTLDTVICNTIQYEFEDNIITIDSLDYYTLLTNPEPLTSVIPYFREENGKVYGRTSAQYSEFLLYDFNAQVNDQIEIGGSSVFGFDIQVLAIDSIELNSGQKRKRLEVGRVENPSIKTYWIEGIGSLLSPFDTRDMFLADVWYDLNCYFFESTIEYSLGDCELTTHLNNPVKEQPLIGYPNPTYGKLHLMPDGLDKINFIEIYDSLGSFILRQRFINQEIDINNLTSGIYFLKAFYKNNSFEIIKIIKY